MQKSQSEFVGRSHPMRGDDSGYEAKIAQDAPNSGNLVDDILNGNFKGHHNSGLQSDQEQLHEGEDLLGGAPGIDDTVEDLLDNLH